MNYEEFLLNYCLRITEVLYKTEVISQLSNDDYALVRMIYEHRAVDLQTLAEKTRTDIEVMLYSECNRFVETKFESGKAFDIGSGIDAIKRYFKLLDSHYHLMYDENIPDTMVNLKDLIIVRLKMIDLASSCDQAMLTYKDSVDVLINRTKNDMVCQLQSLEKELQEKTKGFDDKILDFEQKLNDVTDKKNELYKEIITIISIFAGIILTFAGVFSFSASIMESINLANFYKLVVIASIICIFMSTIFIGFYYFLYNVKHDYPLDEEKYKNTNNEDLVKDTKKKIRLHKLSLIIPMAVADIIFFIIIFVVLFNFSGELSKKDVCKQKAFSDVNITETDDFIKQDIIECRYIWF